VPELRWAGKYDDKGVRVAPLRVELPFQTVETVNESAQDRQRSLDVFRSGGEGGDWRNRLIWGDKKYVLPSLLDEFAGAVNLIYIDPPFYTGDDFTLTVKLDDGAEFEKQPSAIEQKAYRDTWGVSAADRRRGITSLDRYLRWFGDAAVLLYELLAANGSIFVHLDWHVAAYAKVLLDDIFGWDNFRNEIVWCYTGPGSPKMQQFNRKHDNILWYSKGAKSAFYADAVRVAHDAKTEANFKAGLRGSGFVADTYDLDEGGCARSSVPRAFLPRAIRPQPRLRRAAPPSPRAPACTCRCEELPTRRTAAARSWCDEAAASPKNSPRCFSKSAVRVTRS
jgi:hypothetical protein